MSKSNQRWKKPVKTNDIAENQITFDTISSNIKINTEKKNKNRQEKTKPKQIEKETIQRQEDETKPKKVSVVGFEDSEIKETDSILDRARKAELSIEKQHKEDMENARKNPYILKTNIITPAETKLYKLMDKTINEMLKCINAKVVIFPKIRLADIFDVDKFLKNDRSYLYKIAYKHVDYLICDENTFSPICAVELDDFYHERQEKKERDAFVNELFKNAKLKLFRISIPINRVNKSDIGHIADFILESYNPICPNCGSPMVFKKNKTPRRYGHRFYGCTKWTPDRQGCNTTIDID